MYLLKLNIFEWMRLKTKLWVGKQNIISWKAPTVYTHKEFDLKKNQLFYTFYFLQLRV